MDLIIVNFQSSALKKAKVEQIKNWVDLALDYIQKVGGPKDAFRGNSPYGHDIIAIVFEKSLSPNEQALVKTLVDEIQMTVEEYWKKEQEKGRTKSGTNPYDIMRGKLIIITWRDDKGTVWYAPIDAGEYPVSEETALEIAKRLMPGGKEYRKYDPTNSGSSGSASTSHSGFVFGGGSIGKRDGYDPIDMLSEHLKRR